jgi:SpoVK/Ycf46/Vps4 family AAA+-type ATPase
LLRRHLVAEERIVAYLLGADNIDTRLLSYVRQLKPVIRLEDVLLPADAKRQLALLAGKQARNSTGHILYFQGPYGVGKRTTARALCRQIGLDLLVVDGERLLGAEGAAFESLVRLAIREAKLLGAALYWGGFDALLADDRHAERELLLRALADSAGLSFLAGNTAWEPADGLADLPFVRIEFAPPGATGRISLWQQALDRSGMTIDSAALRALAGMFRLSGGQIRDAVATAQSLALRRDPERPEATEHDLAAASRLHSNHRLIELAQPIVPRYGWGDIVLPPDRLAQLREICRAVQYHPQVYDEWGFGRKLALGKGVSALFAGPSGTGKTMAADIIAGELGLELYKIDLATVVSKYIGETEKNLARIFAEAESSNAILFFDEADALFGKRSEVKDAHDRYANLEIAYLLQRMEAYEGVVILATNLRKNMDEAFVRRLQFIVEFPFPGERERRRIWEVIWPAETPRDTTVDPGALARRFELAGGNIRNIALGAAYLAAGDGQVVTIGHVLRATRREYQKLGKVASEADFAACAQPEPRQSQREALS